LLQKNVKNTIFGLKLMMFEKLIFCPLFVGLDNETIIHLLNQVQHQILQYKKDQLIAYSGDEVESQMIVLKGSVKGEMVDFTGKTIKIEDIASPRPLAPAFLFGNQNSYPVNIVANTNVEMLAIPKSSFVQLMQMNATILENFLSLISNRAQFLSNKIRFLSFQTIKGKIAHYLLESLKNKETDVVILDKSQNELAESFGVARPSLGRALREMDHEGSIKAKGKQIQILNKAGLSSLLK
jgi:CRP-like cAMP-binding protein